MATDISLVNVLVGVLMYLLVYQGLKDILHHFYLIKNCRISANCSTIIHVDISRDINFLFLYCWSYSSTISVYVCLRIRGKACLSLFHTFYRIFST